MQVATAMILMGLVGENQTSAIGYLGRAALIAS